jgi:hypothetical protein
MDINCSSYLPFFKLSNDLSKIVDLLFTIHILKNTPVELCANNYVIFDDLVNKIDGMFKETKTYNRKTIIQIMFSKL